MSEEWRPIDGYEGVYSVSNEGRIRSELRMVQRSDGKMQKVRERIMRPVKKKTNHCTIMLHPKMVRMHIHRAVAFAFIGPPPSDRHEIAHNDGNPLNNRVENLRWTTRSDNFADKVRHGTHNRGDRHPNVKVSDAAIRALRDFVGSNKAAAHAFSVSMKYAWAVRTGKTRTFA